MNKVSAPIPLSSVVVLPRWLLVVGVITSALCVAAGFALLGYGIAVASGPRLGGYVGAALGCILGGGGALFGVLRDWTRRIPANVLLHYLRQDRPLPFYRKVFVPASILCALGVVAGLVWGGPAIWHGMVQTGGLLAFLSGVQELGRRHLHRVATAIFTLYAEGALDPRDVVAIEDARRKDADFDLAVRSHQALHGRVADLLRESDSSASE